MADLKVVPMTIKRADHYIHRWHRHHKPAQGGLFAVAVARMADGEVCGVAVVGRCSARLFDQAGNKAEITRIATDGTRNTCSKLVAVCRRILRIMGYEEFITYTLPEEGGASLRGAGLQYPVPAGGGTWDKPSRHRIDKHDTCLKDRWGETINTPCEPYNCKVLEALDLLEQYAYSLDDEEALSVAIHGRAALDKLCKE